MPTAEAKKASIRKVIRMVEKKARTTIIELLADNKWHRRANILASVINTCPAPQLAARWRYYRKGELRVKDSARQASAGASGMLAVLANMLERLGKIERRPKPLRGKDWEARAIPQTNGKAENGKAENGKA